MHAVALRPIVLEEDLDGISDFCVQRRAKQSEVLPLGRALFESGERAVGVFVINGLVIDVADLVLARFEIHFRVLVGRHAHHLVHAHGGVVPVDFIDGDVVSAGFTFSAGQSGGKREGGENTHHRENCRKVFSHGVLRGDEV